MAGLMLAASIFTVVDGMSAAPDIRSTGFESRGAGVMVRASAGSIKFRLRNNGTVAAAPPAASWTVTAGYIG